MPAHSIKLGNITFDKKGDALIHLQSMLAEYDVGDKVGSDDEKILMDAISRHPDAISKIGAGVSHFSVRMAEYGTKCFWVNRSDGTTEKFSYKACIYTPRKKKA